VATKELLYLLLCWSVAQICLNSSIDACGKVWSPKMTDPLVLHCVRVGSKLRVRLLGPQRGYSPFVNIQFPRALRAEGAVFHVDAPLAIDMRNAVFYRINTKSIRQQPATPPDRVYLEESCCVCLELAPAMLFAPCGHACVCEGCDRGMPRCPMCRADVRQRLRLCDIT